jgi:CubicO group peptidase (beta-lactamase class C family)
MPARRPVTVLNLLLHTAGFTYGMFGDSLVQRLYREADVMSPAQTNEQMLHKLAQLPLQAQPDSTFEYGMSTDVLGRVIEVASNQSLGEVVAQRITRPLGMTRTGFVVPGAGLARPRTPAEVLFDYDPLQPPVWCSGGAGLLSTAGDYQRFCRMLLQGGTLDGAKVLSPRFVTSMLANHLPRAIAFGASTKALGINAPLPELGQGHGLGVGVRCRDALSPVPGSVGDFFWSGALGTYFWADPVKQVVAVLMLQENDIEVRTRYRSMLRHAVYRTLELQNSKDKQACKP